MAKGKTALEILTEARNDIKPKTWICGDLSILAADDKGKPKHMACALGLVALAAKAVDRQAVSFYNPLTNNYENIRFAYATYPDQSPKKWTLEAIKAVAYLVLALPVSEYKHEVYDDNGYVVGTFTTHEAAREVLSAKRKPTIGTISFLSGQVTGYNDGTCSTYSTARNWFNDALKLARKDAKASASKSA